MSKPTQKKQRFTTGKGCNNRKLSDEDRAEIARLYTTPAPDGTWMGGVELGRLFGVTHQAIYYALRCEGVETRTMSEAHKGKACKPITNLPVGDPPSCKCGCGELTEWNQRKNHWNRYVRGHYTRRLEQGPSWQGGRSFEPYAPGWPAISREARERDGFRCQACGGTDRLHVHHIDTDKLNNESANLITLCNSCHSQVHAELLKGGGA